MSETMEVEAPSRGRKPRADVSFANRRRRSNGSLNRLAQMRLDFLDPETLDLENYVYRWVNDESGRLRMLTRQDDYDFVTSDDLGDGYDADAFDQESDGRLRVMVGERKGGGPLYAYLCRKPKAFWEADYAEAIQNREDMMRGRVFAAELAEDGEGLDNAYVPKGNTIGHAGERRRGPIPRRIK